MNSARGVLFERNDVEENIRRDFPVSTFRRIVEVKTPVRNPRPLCNRLNLQFDFTKTASKISSYN